MEHMANRKVTITQFKVGLDDLSLKWNELEPCIAFEILNSFPAGAYHCKSFDNNFYHHYLNKMLLRELLD